MRIGTALKAILKSKKISQKELSKMMGFAGQSNVCNIINRDGRVEANTIIRMADILGYELVLQPRKAGRRPEGQILLSEDDEGLTEETKE